MAGTGPNGVCTAGFKLDDWNGICLNQPRGSIENMTGFLMRLGLGVR
jgi:hypothetical protein